jgi:hypothetical protein
MTLQHAQAISILQCVVAVGEGSTRLGVLLGGPSFYYWIWFLQPEGFGNMMFCSLYSPFFGCFGFFMIGFLVFPLFLGALVFLWLAGFHQFLTHEFVIIYWSMMDSSSSSSTSSPYHEPKHFADEFLTLWSSIEAWWILLHLLLAVHIMNLNILQRNFLLKSLWSYIEAWWILRLLLLLLLLLVVV